MQQFSIFSRRNGGRLYRDEVEGNEHEAKRAARALEVLGSQIDDCVELENGHLVRQVERGQRRLKEQTGW